MEPYPNSLSSQIIEIARCDRWQVRQRLEELGISSTCSHEGSLKVEVHSPVALAQLHSVLRQFTASRQQLLDWMEQCWQKS